MEQNGASFLFQKQRLIDADKFEKLVLNHRASYLHKEDVVAALSKQPTVAAVELPCKVGDMVYRKDGAWTVVGFECDRAGSWRVKLERWKDQFWDYHESTKVVFKSFGKTVFLTSDAVASALAKMEVKK